MVSSDGGGKKKKKGERIPKINSQLEEGGEREERKEGGKGEKNT